MKKNFCAFFICLFVFYPNFQNFSFSFIPEKVVALSFDDGPTKYTPEIIEYLKSEKVKATFFIVGNKIEGNETTIKKSIKFKNEIGNHTYSHLWITKRKEDVAIDEIKRTNEIIKNKFRYSPTLFRPCYGAITKDFSKKIEMDIVFWTLDSNDWKIKKADKIANQIIDNIHSNDIILMHDSYQRSLEALKIVIPILKKQGYYITTISEMKDMNFLKQNYEI